MKLERVTQVLAQLLARKLEKKHPKFACLDCGLMPDYFMVHDDIWHTSGFPKHAFACIPCLEKRIGRRLTIYNFNPNVHVNHPIFIGYKLALEDERNKVEQKEEAKPALAARGWEPAHVPAPPRPVSKSPNWDVV